MLNQIWAVTAVVLSLAMCAVVVYFLVTGRDDRDRDEEARDFFTRNGHWPDEEPG